MIDKSSIKRLENVAKSNRATIHFEESSDGAYIDCEIAKNDMALYVILTRFGDRYYAYGLNSDIAPSELYLDLKSDEHEELERRENEIFEDINLLLQKKLTYYKRPSIFNKRRGYVELQVDGKVTKLWQKENKLNLPEM